MFPLIRGLIAVAIMGGFFIAVFSGVALPKDNGQWEKVPPQIREWFRGLKNDQGVPCCSEADGHQLGDDDWKIDDSGRFLVRLDGRWFQVPQDKVLNIPNRIGVAILWISTDGHIYCFLPASLS